MKKTLLFLLVLGLFSCSKNSGDPGSNSSNNIVGKWMIHDQLYVYSLGGKEVYRKDDVIPMKVQGNYYYQFNADGTAGTYEYRTSSSSYVLFDNNDKYTVSNNSLTYIYTSGPPPQQVYTLAFVDANTITLSVSRTGSIAYELADHIHTGQADQETDIYTFTRFN